jgi:hypothetical protein
MTHLQLHGPKKRPWHFKQKLVCTHIFVVVFCCGASTLYPHLYKCNLARTLAPALRIQMSIVILDGMVCNEGAEYGFDQDDFDLFAESGMLIRKMLTVPLDIEQSDAEAKQLF